jgi:outer membrane receptor protein involved in Fe transport
VSLNGVLGEGRRSDGTFTDVTGASYELEDQAETNPRWLSMDLAFRQLRVRFLYDGHEITSRDGFGEMSARADRMEFGALYGSAQYALEIGDRVTVTPRLSYKRQTSWRVVDETSDYYFDKIYERMVAAALVEYDVSRHVSVLSGLELTLDRGRLADESLADVGLNSSFGGESEVTYEDVAVYSQLGLSHRIANVTLGARYELHSQVGGSFVPRVGVTRVFGDFHVKVLASSAFRAPSVENLNLNPDLAPERTIAFEIETGMKLGDHAFIGANAFDVTIHDPIVYAVVDGEEAYFNFDRSGTRGVEIELRLRYPWGTVDASGSLATANGKNNVPLYQVPDDDDRMLGMPLYKLAASAALRPHRSFTIAPSLIVLGPHAAYHQVDVDGNALLRRSDATVLANLFLSWRVPGVKGLEIGAGVANAFDAPEEFPQPYDGGHPPLPGRSRTVFGRVSWDVGF